MGVLAGRVVGEVFSDTGHRLGVGEFAVDGRVGQQRAMGADCDDPACVDDRDLVGVPDRRDPVACR